MGARTGSCLLNVLAAVCFAIVIMAVVRDRILAATQMSSAQALSCSHPREWKSTDLELHRILARHFGWLSTRFRTYDLEAFNALDHAKPAYPEWRREARSHPVQANLCNANLNGATLNGATLDSADLRSANLNGARLDGAYLNGANLEGAHLNGARLYGAHLNGANLNFAYLNGVNLYGADLSKARLYGAHLNHAVLSGVDLSGADLTQANLRGVDLRGANVSKAKLAAIDLTGAYYARFGAPDPDVGDIKGLSTLRFLGREEIAGLVQLQKAFQDAGLRDDEREVTSAIERNITRNSLGIEGILRFVGFDVTTGYGLHPTNALGWILLLGAVLTPVYMRVMLHPTAMSGVVQVFPEDRLDGITAGDPADGEKRKKVVIQAKNWRDAFLSAAYFSLISAVNIGFEQFTPGDWIRRLQACEYSLEAVGWVRIVAGAQALLSVYLLAMWVLTQFGRPFE
jgi:uncharacterized protein YjbI with pentapeptide repeats